MGLWVSVATEVIKLAPAERPATPLSAVNLPAARSDDTFDPSDRHRSPRVMRAIKKELLTVREQEHFVADNGILSLVSIDPDGCIRVAANGSVTAAGAHFLGKNPLEAILGVTWFSNRVLIDLSKTDFIDSAAIGWLIGSAKEFRTRGGRMAVHSVTPRVWQMLNLLKIGQLVPFLPDEAAARRFVTEGATASAQLVAAGA